MTYGHPIGEGRPTRYRMYTNLADDKTGVASGIPFKTNSRFSRTAGQSPGLIHPVMPFLTNGVENTFQLFNNKFYLTFWRSVKPVGYSRSGEVAALVMSF